jgi:hypothetical protein
MVFESVRSAMSMVAIGPERRQAVMANENIPEKQVEERRY